MLTVYENTLQSTLEKINKALICMGNDYTLQNSYGIGNEYNREKYIQLTLLKKTLCLNLCKEKKTFEIINKLLS